MLDNVFIWIDGFPGSGKTLLIERVLQASRNKSIGAIRLRKKKRIRDPKEVKAGNEETRRYAAAGADRTMLVEYCDKGETGVSDFVFCSGFLSHGDDAIYCEAELSDEQFPMDLNVFVLPPLEDPSAMISVEEIAVDDKFIRDYFAKAFAHVIPKVEKAMNKTFDEVCDELLAQSDVIPKNPGSTQIIRLAPGFEGLIAASTVVINVRNDADRRSAEQMIELLAKIDKKPMSIEQSYGFFWRQKKWVFVCDLGDPKDEQLKKLVSKLKRKTVAR